jgi:CelD/BcsL family acetyltransferase involved in cellulose biosynthesis
MLQLSHYELTDVPALSRDWQTLEKIAEVSFFLSWHWIGTWLDVFKPAVFVVRAERQDGTLVGLGLMSRAVERRHGVLQTNTLRLHQTGHWAQDQIWIEYNGFLTDPNARSQTEQQLTAYLCQQFPAWDELVLGAIDEEKAQQLKSQSQLFLHERWSAPCYGVDLLKLRIEQQQYLASLSHNTRYQIRRAERMYQLHGMLSLRRPVSVNDALNWFDKIGPLHIRRWGSGPHQSGFANPQFVSFHRLLIERCWEMQQVDIVALYAGEQHVATFYNLVYGNRVYFYLSGIEAVSDNKEKPGLLGHSYCIQQYLERGFDFYDFMGGNERYKTQLGHWHGRLVQVAMQRPRLKLKLEQVGRWLKNCWGQPAVAEGNHHD